MPTLRANLAAAIEAAKGQAGAKDPVGQHYQVRADGTVMIDAVLLRDGTVEDLADTKRGAKA